MSLMIDIQLGKTCKADEPSGCQDEGISELKKKKKKKKLILWTESDGAMESLNI